MSVNDLIEEGVSLFNNKNIDEAITNLNLALNQIEDKRACLEEQNNIQFWFGRCYLEQAIKAKGVTEAKKLFEQATVSHQQQLQLAKQAKDKQVSIQGQNSAHYWLGRCYFEQSIKVKNIPEAKKLFEKSIYHYQQCLELAKQLLDKKISLIEQNKAQSNLSYCYFREAIKTRGTYEAEELFEQAIQHLKQWLENAKRLQDQQMSIQEQKVAQFGLGCCSLEWAIKSKDATETKKLFEKAIEHHQQQLKLAEQLINQQTSILAQNDALFNLGHCYFRQAIMVRDIDEVKELFKKAIEHHQQQLKLAEQLINQQTSIQRQIYAQSWLGSCYLEQAVRTKDIEEAKDLFEQAIAHHQQELDLTKQLDDKKERKIFEERACISLRNICFLKKDRVSYFNKKKQEIHKALFSNKDNLLDKTLKEAISTILAVLYIPPIELGLTPLAHYTSSTVCNKLFGVVNEDDPSPMRIGSSTYMNDPSEGKGLLELLALQDLELENKADCSPHNAFFACFSARVNDLNQFRLYGKEDGVEASGCCLVFNKNRDWLKEPDISAPFRSFLKNLDENSAEFKETDISNVEYEKLPLYQVAYIAHKDEYITKEKCEIWLDNLKVGICLKPIGENNDWHNFRLNQLKEALQELAGFFKEKDHVNDKNKNALEYIRYLFKDFAFRDEEEFRVLKMAEIGSEEIEYFKPTQSIYLPYADISNVVDEVILGTNYEKTNSRPKAEVFQHQMRQKCPNVKVSRSSLPIYANPPIKKD